MRICLSFLVTWAGLILESTLFQIPPMNAIHPGIVLVIIVLIALLQGTSVSMILAIVVGLIQDICYGSFIGLNAFSYALVAYFAGAVFSQFMNKNLAITFMTTVSLTFVHIWMTYGLTRLFEVTADRPLYVLSQSLVAMLFNGLLVLMLYPLMGKLLTPSRVRSYDIQEKDTL